MARRQWTVFWLKLKNQQRRQDFTPAHCFFIKIYLKKAKEEFDLEKGVKINRQASKTKAIHTKFNTNQVMVAFLVGRNNFYQMSSRGCKRSDRIIFVLILKIIHTKNSLRDSWVKTEKEMNALS